MAKRAAWAKTICHQHHSCIFINTGYTRDRRAIKRQLERLSEQRFCVLCIGCDPWANHLLLGKEIACDRTGLIVGNKCTLSKVSKIRLKYSLAISAKDSGVECCKP